MHADKHSYTYNHLKKKPTKSTKQGSQQLTETEVGLHEAYMGLY